MRLTTRTSALLAMLLLASSAHAKTIVSTTYLPHGSLIPEGEYVSEWSGSSGEKEWEMRGEHDAQGRSTTHVGKRLHAQAQGDIQHVCVVHRDLHVSKKNRLWTCTHDNTSSDEQRTSCDGGEALFTTRALGNKQWLLDVKLSGAAVQKAMDQSPEKNIQAMKEIQAQMPAADQAQMAKSTELYKRVMEQNKAMQQQTEAERAQLRAKLDDPRDKDLPQSPEIRARLYQLTGSYAQHPVHTTTRLTFFARECNK